MHIYYKVFQKNFYPTEYQVFDFSLIQKSFPK